MNVELTRFKVKKGKTKAVDEWLQFLNHHMEEVLLTLEGEKMYIETIFREVQNEDEYLYWYSVQGRGGVEVTESTHWVDKKHLQYWQDCIDETYQPVNLNTEVVIIPEKIRTNMK